jgi:hypothetical protein
MSSQDGDFLRFIAARLVEVHGESENVDFIHTLNSLALEHDAKDIKTAAEYVSEKYLRDRDCNSSVFELFAKRVADAWLKEHEE